jgi:hypothetical protein
MFIKYIPSAPNFLLRSWHWLHSLKICDDIAVKSDGLFFFLKSRDRAVGIAAGYVLDDQGVAVRVPVGARIFASPRRPYSLWGPPNLLSNEYLGVFLRGVKRPGHEADHSRPTSPEVKEMWIYTSIPPYAFMASCLIS